MPKLSLLANRRAKPAGIAGGARCNAPQYPPLSVAGISGTRAFGTALLFARRCEVLKINKEELIFVIL